MMARDVDMQTAGDTLSQHDQAVHASRRTRERMLQAMRVLEVALAKAAPHRESAWRRRVVTALRELQRVMQTQSAELSGDQELFAELLTTAPRLQRRIEQLRQQYEDLTSQIGSLVAQFSGEEYDGHADVDDTRQRLAWLLTALRHFQARENDLIYEAIAVDIGEVD